MTAEELSAYYDRLERHDWYWPFKTGKRYHAGDLAEAELSAIANRDPHARVMFDQFRRYHSSGPAFGTERAPMPERPLGQLTIC